MRVSDRGLEGSKSFANPQSEIRNLQSARRPRFCLELKIFATNPARTVFSRWTRTKSEVNPPDWTALEEE
jgi:hypothetical protein